MRVFHKKLILILAVLAILLYGLWQARNFLSGPRIYLESPDEGEVIEGSALLVRGRASDVNEISLNGRIIFTNEEGEFEEELILPPGLSLIELEAEDRFGHETRVKRMVVRK